MVGRKGWKKNRPAWRPLRLELEMLEMLDFLVWNFWELGVALADKNALLWRYVGFNGQGREGNTLYGRGLGC